MNTCITVLTRPINEDDYHEVDCVDSYIYESEENNFPFYLQHTLYSDCYEDSWFFLNDTYYITMWVIDPKYSAEAIRNFVKEYK